MAALMRVLGLLVVQAPLDCALLLGLSLLPGLIAAVAVVASRTLFTRIEGLSAGGPLLPVVRAATVYGGLLAAGEIVPALTGLATMGLNDRLQITVERLWLRHVSALPLRLREDPAIQDVLDRAGGFIRGGRLLRSGRRLILLPREVLVAGGLVAGLVVIGPWLAIAAVAAAVPTVVQRLRLGPLFYWFTAHRSRTERALGYLAGLLQGRGPAAEIRALGLGPLLLERWTSHQRALLEERWRFEVRRLPGDTVSHLVGTGAVGYGLALAWAVALVLRGQIGVPACAAALTALWAFQDAFRYLVISLGAAQTEGLALGDFLAVADTPGAQRPATGLPRPDPLRQGISLEHVTFTYPGQARPALVDVSLHIAAGERVALVGENGAGKTTFARLVLGLFVPDSGVVRIDGLPLEAGTTAALHDRVAAVLQDPLRLRLTLRDNIGFGDLAHRDDDDAIRAAADHGGLQGLIAHLPEGLGTWCDPARPGGTDLSGGQWQRIALARAAMRRQTAGIVVLDEPTAALDPETESEVLARLLEATRGRTALVVSHRLGLARLCDRVVVLAGGRVAETGTHAELLATGGIYAELWATQAGWYESGDR